MLEQMLIKWSDVIRTDRTRHRICYADTYQTMFDTLEKKLVEGKTKHLLLLLGVPIGMSIFTFFFVVSVFDELDLAYPRLVWAESLMTSKLMAPLRMLNKMFGIMSGLFNEYVSDILLASEINSP